jgi:hypothetical protein
MPPPYPTLEKYAEAECSIDLGHRHMIQTPVSWSRNVNAGIGL